MSLTFLALAGSAAACSTGSLVTAQQKRAVAGILQAPKDLTSPLPTREPTTTSSASSVTPTSTSVGPGPSSSPPTSTAAPTTAAVGAPPNVVGQSLSTAENQLGAAGYSANAQPWDDSCSTPGQVIQQVPPQAGVVQLFYCTKVT
jgi:hypothetical protein